MFLFPLNILYIAEFLFLSHLSDSVPYSNEIVSSHWLSSLSHMPYLTDSLFPYFDFNLTTTTSFVSYIHIQSVCELSCLCVYPLYWDRVHVLPWFHKYVTPGRRRASALLLSPERTSTSTNYHWYDRDWRRASALLLSTERTSTSTSYHHKDCHRRRTTTSCWAQNGRQL
jgi:hypothetical protein